jgi:acylphosphatase
LLSLAFFFSLFSRLQLHRGLWNALMGMSGKSARRYVVQGRVQGVGFRWFVQRRASALGVTGYVRNLDEGHVEVLAMGAPKSLDRLREELWRGPIGARVSAVQESDAPVGDSPSFEITY